MSGIISGVSTIQQIEQRCSIWQYTQNETFFLSRDKTPARVADSPVDALKRSGQGFSREGRMDAFWGLYGLKKAGRRPARNLFIIEVGKRSIQAKSLVNHGHWQHWLELNFQLGQSAANKFMSVAERFANSESIPILKSTQMIQLLALPSAEETEKFIAEKAAEGKAVAEMTIKELREEIAQSAQVYITH